MARLRVSYPANVESVYDPVDALEREFANRFRFSQRLYCGTNLTVNENLPVARLCTQSCCQVHDSADSRIIVSPLKTNESQRRIPVGDANSEPKLVTLLTPLYR